MHFIYNYGKIKVGGYMENIEIKIDKLTRTVVLEKTHIGNEGENLQGNLVFSFIEDFVNGYARLEYSVEGVKNFITLTQVEETYQIPIKSAITKEGRIEMQLVITEDETETGKPIFKSDVFYLYCDKSINAVEEAPDGYEIWLDTANEKLEEMDNINVELEGAVLTITRRDGTQYSENVQGPQGPQGPQGTTIANEVTVTENSTYFPGKSVEEALVTIKEINNK